MGKNTPARVKGGSYGKLLPPVMLRRKKVHNPNYQNNGTPNTKDAINRKQWNLVH